MKKFQREDIQIIARNSNWSEEGIQEVLDEDVYNDKLSWQKFLRLFFISFGVAFTLAGIIFFFAYNWDKLDKFFKIGIVEVLLFGTTLFLVYSNTSLFVKKVLLTVASILVGVLLAIFGQIYQTGANSFDLFFVWTLLITIWVVISNFTPLWLVYILLINITVILYSNQLSDNWSYTTMCTVLFLVNLVFLLASLYSRKVDGAFKVPVWFSNLLALSCVTYITVGVISAMIYESPKPQLYLIIIAALAYYVGISNAMKTKNIYFLVIILFSIIVIIFSFIIKATDDVGDLLFAALFMIASVSSLIVSLNKLQSKWKS